MISPGAPSLGGARTISAAAFKRPRNASTDNPGDPFAKKSLPSSPYPAPRDPFAPGGAGGAYANVNANATTMLAGPPVEMNEEDDYDYISAYVGNSNPNSPHRASFDAAAGQGHGQGPAGRLGGGYNDGRFATNLEDGSLR